MKQTLYFLLFSLLIIGCKETDDSEKPEVLIESPSAGEVITTNDNLRLVATITDNTGLLQYKITLNGIDSLNDVGRDSTLSIILIDGIPNKVDIYYLDKLIELDNSTFNGYYVVTLSCVDVEGNESVPDTVRFQIKNSIDSEPPVINVAGPTKDTLGINHGFVLSGTVTDSQSLIYSDLFIGKKDFSDTIRFVTFPWISNNTIDYDNQFNWWIQVDSTWNQGQYHLYYTAWDNYSGVSKSIPFYVKY